VDFAGWILSLSESLRADLFAATDPAAINLTGWSRVDLEGSRIELIRQLLPYMDIDGRG